MASPKIGRIRKGEGRPVKQMKTSDLLVRAKASGKDKLKAINELTRRGVSI